MDYSAEPPSYNDLRLNAGGNKDGPISDSPHQSDDEETAMLKEELRRLRERNQNIIHSSNTGRENGATPSTQHQTTATVQYTSSGPVYHHPVTTAVVSNEASGTTTQTSGGDVNPGIKICATCTVMTIVIVVIVLIIFSSTNSTHYSY